MTLNTIILTMKELTNHGMSLGKFTVPKGFFYWGRVGNIYVMMGSAYTVHILRKSQLPSI
jgi:hypothetical protein